MNLLWSKVHIKNIHFFQFSITLNCLDEASSVARRLTLNHKHQSMLVNSCVWKTKLCTICAWFESSAPLIEGQVGNFCKKVFFPPIDLLNYALTGKCKKIWKAEASLFPIGSAAIRWNTPIPGQKRSKSDVFTASYIPPYHCAFCHLSSSHVIV